MKRSSRLVERSLNTMSVAAGIFLVAILTSRYLFSPSHDLLIEESPQLGTRVVLPGFDWTSHQNTLILALSVDCSYCSESMGFYQKLLHAASSRSVRAVAVFPQSVPEAHAYLLKHDLVLDEVKEAALGGIGIRATPSILLVDSSGRIRSRWVGKLTPKGENEVFGEIAARVSSDKQDQGEPKAPQGEYLTPVQFKELLREEPVVPAIDIREREQFSSGHILDALNIPLDELEPRARAEIPKWPTVVLYCNFCSSCKTGAGTRGFETECTIGAFVMNREGYRSVKLVDESLAKLKEAGIKVVEGK